MTDKLEFDTLAIHAGQAPDPQTGALTVPIHLSTTFAQQGPGKHKGFEYGRTDNPTRRSLEACLSALEGGTHAAAFASGSAATVALLQTLSPGDHVVACDDVYGGTYRIMEQLFVPNGVQVSWVDMTQLKNVEAAIREETRMLWVETPTNPLLKLVDMKALGWLAGTGGITLVVDNTFATPVLQKPLLTGASVVVHSSTKYLNGHGDVIGGAIVTDDEELMRRVRFVQNAGGAIPSPFDCYMTLRGIKTLPLRVRHQSETALSLAEWLTTHPEVEQVRYPWLDSHPQAKLARRQMAAGGGMLSLSLRGGGDAARALLKGVRLFACAESLGGVESLVEHPASMTHASVPPEVRAQTGIGDGLVRLSVGLEAPKDLREDLAQALAAL